MCLKKARIPKKTSGIGYKFVREIPGLSGTFDSEWTYFTDQGGDSYRYRKEHVMPRTRYTLGEITRVIPICNAKILESLGNETYPAGIHVWKVPPYGSPDDPMILIEVEYWDALVEDNDVIVVKAVKPLRIMQGVYSE
jgi:hypothetical protein